MQRIVSAITALALALSFFGSAAQPAAAVTGYDSAYFGESAFLSLAPGTTGQFVAIFTNTASTGWVTGTATQVNLAVCLADKLTCNVASPNAAWNPGTWLSSTAYATTSTGYVGPGQQGFFVYSVRAPAGGGYARFNGDLSLAATGAMIHPRGYYQDAFSAAPSGAAAAVLTSMTPTTGPTAGGTSVTITGTGFICTPTVPTVTVGGVSATVTSCSATTLDLTTPPGTAGSANVVVTNTGAPASNALPFVYDGTAPTLVSASGAAGSSTITLTFSEPVYCTGSFPAATATITSVPATTNTVNAIVCPNTAATAGTTFTLTTSAPLMANTAYTVSLTTSAATGQVRDVAGNLMTSPASATFTTGAADTIAPLLVSASGVTGSSTVTATFSEPVYCTGSFHGPAVLSITSTGAPILVLSDTCPNVLASTTFTAALSAALAPNTTYTFTITTSPANGEIFDVAGNRMSSPSSAVFTTGPGTTARPSASLASL